MVRMILFVVALLPLLATVDCNPAGSRDSRVICKVSLPHGFNESPDLPHDCENDKRYKVSFIRLNDLEEKATIQLFFEPKEDRCVDKLGLEDKKLFCEWENTKSSIYESCDRRPDYTAQWQDSDGRIHIEILRPKNLQDATECE